MKRRFAIFALAFLPALGFAAPKEAAPAAPKKETAAAVEKVRFKTNQGDFVIELNREKAPLSVANFLSYVKKKHFDGTVFHRIMPTFMIQGGGFVLKDGKLVQKPVDKPIKNESQNGLKNVRGSVAMARTGELDSATSQFFINVVDNAALDYPNNGGYAVFGKVVEGMDVVDKIKASPTGTATIIMRHPKSGDEIEMPAEDVPKEAVIIQSATVE